MPSPASRRLSKQAGRAQQRRGYAQTLAHAVRVAPHAVIRARCQLDQIEHLRDAPARIAPVQRGQQLEVLAAAQIGIEARRLHKAGHALQRARAIAHGVASEQLHVALAGCDESEGHAQGGGLAGAVRAEKAVHVAHLHRQVDAIDGEDLSVALDQSEGADRRRAAGHARGPAQRPRSPPAPRSRGAGSARRSARSSARSRAESRARLRSCR